LLQVTEGGGEGGQGSTAAAARTTTSTTTMSRPVRCCGGCARLCMLQLVLWLRVAVRVRVRAVLCLQCINSLPVDLIVCVTAGATIEATTTDTAAWRHSWLLLLLLLLPLPGVTHFASCARIAARSCVLLRSKLLLKLMPTQQRRQHAGCWAGPWHVQGAACGRAQLQLLQRQRLRAQQALRPQHWLESRLAAPAATQPQQVAAAVLPGCALLEGRPLQRHTCRCRGCDRAAAGRRPASCQA
jgi:hypothetical protein